ncbi:MAG: DUF309 domain-containing protein [Dehalococcoidia bacterium]
MDSEAKRRRMPRIKLITVPGNLRQACAEFNGGRYFECHETLEEIWQEEAGDVRDLYKGLIQVAAAFVHLTRGNYVGADRLSRTALGYLAPYRPGGAMGFDVDAICRQVESAHRALIANGPENVVYDPGAAPHFACDESHLAAEGLRWRAWGFDRDGRALEMQIDVLD